MEAQMAIEAIEAYTEEAQLDTAILQPVVVTREAALFFEKYCQDGIFTRHVSLPVQQVRCTYNAAQRVLFHRERPEKPSESAVRNMNNFLKSVLFSGHIRRGSTILELAAGNGKNIAKLEYVKPKLVVHCDVAELPLMEAEKRWKRNKFPYPSCFLHVDFCSKEFLRNRAFFVYEQQMDRLPGEARREVLCDCIEYQPELFDVVSCQFGPQYAFFSFDSAFTFVHNVQEALKRGGIFMGIAPRGETVLEYHNRTPAKDSLFSVEFYDNMEGACPWRLSNGVGPGYSGVAYRFKYGDVIDCKEFTMLFSDLCQLCEEADLKLLYCYDLDDLARREVLNPKNQTLLERMKIVPDSFTDADYELLGLYCAFAFVKQ